MSVELVSSSGESSDECFALGHADSLSAVLVNLIDNAIKFAPERSKVTVSVRSGEADRVLIEVRDQGAELSSHEGQRIFDRFYQADDRLDRKGGGVGLGLSISRQLVELMGGRIGWRAAGGGRRNGDGSQGNVFFVDLEACAAHPVESKVRKPGRGAVSNQHG